MSSLATLPWNYPSPKVFKKMGYNSFELLLTRMRGKKLEHTPPHTLTCDADRHFKVAFRWRMEKGALQHERITICQHLSAIPSPEWLTLERHWLLTGRKTVSFTALYQPDTHTHTHTDLCFVKMSSVILHPAFSADSGFPLSLSLSFTLCRWKTRTLWRRSRRCVNSALTPRWCLLPQRTLGEQEALKTQSLCSCACLIVH